MTNDPSPLPATEGDSFDDAKLPRPEIPRVERERIEKEKQEFIKIKGKMEKLKRVI